MEAAPPTDSRLPFSQSPRERTGHRATGTPDLYVGYFRDLGELAASGEMTPGAILAVMARYATYPAGTPAPSGTDRGTP